MREDASPATRPRVALLHWGDLIEDFLSPIGLSFQDFRDGMTGGWMFGYVDALARAGVDTVLVCVSAEVDKPERHRHRDTGAPLWRLPASQPYLLLRRLQSGDAGAARSLRRVAWQLSPYLATPLRHLAAVLRSEGCRALLCQEYEHPRFDACVLLGAWLRVPVFATFQGGDWHTYRLERWTRPPALRACSGLIVGTEVEARRLGEEYPSSTPAIARIPNPFDAAAWGPKDGEPSRIELGFEPTSLVITWHGRVDVHVKGLDVLLDAWRQLRRSLVNRDVRLLLVGTGADASRLRRDLAADPCVYWVDEYVLSAQRRRRYLSAADVYCLPSRHEGFPAALLEAMACGLPVVATDLPSVREILPSGEASGALIVPGEDPIALASALQRILRDDPLRQSLAKRAQLSIATAYAPEAVGQSLRHVLLGE